MYNIPILHGTRRNGNLSSRVAQYALHRLKALDFIETSLLDLSTYDFPIMEERTTESTVLSPLMAEFFNKLAAADALLIVCPEYKNGMPGALKNAFDYLPPKHLSRKPVGIITVSSGPFGGLDCLTQVRLACIALAAVVVPERFPVSFVQDNFDAEGKPADKTKMDERFDKLWKELLWHTEATTARQRKPD
jgi:NAD(P)H-dependent FMN reductase